MRRVNIFDVELDPGEDHGTIANRGAAVGELIGASRIGAGLYELEAGKWVWPYHYHHGVEEWLYVAAGSPVLRDPGGERTLAAGDLVAWPSGWPGAHTVAGPGRIVIFSTGGWPDASVCVYPDSDKVGARPGKVEPPRLDTLNFRRSDAVDYWLGEGAGGEPGPARIVPLPERGEHRPVVALGSVELGADDADPPGFVCRYARLGPLLGAERIGASVYEFDPGEGTCAYHYELAEEEWGLVLAGTPTLRHPDGEAELAVGDAVCFPIGPAGAHRFLNRAADPARVMILSTLADSGATLYPDSEKVTVWGPGGFHRVFRLADAVDYWDGEHA